jgi:hypothetical protein
VEVGTVFGLVDERSPCHNAIVPYLKYIYIFMSTVSKPGPSHKRTEGRAPVLGYASITKAATPHWYYNELLPSLCVVGLNPVVARARVYERGWPSYFIVVRRRKNVGVRGAQICVRKLGANSSVCGTSECAAVQL